MTAEYIQNGLDNARTRYEIARSWYDCCVKTKAGTRIMQTASEDLEFWGNKLAFFESQVGRAEH